jgi:hypothetical protein
MKQDETDNRGNDDSLSTSESEYPPLDDETLSRIADESFLEYDIREAESEHRPEVPHESGSASEEFHHHE